MKSATLGKRTSGAEVTNISGHGFWLLVADEELFVSFKEFPWFKDASVSEILNVEWTQQLHPHQDQANTGAAAAAIQPSESLTLMHP